MVEDREDAISAIEVDAEPIVSRLYISMRGKMAIAGLAFFSVAILLLVSTHPGMVDAFRRLQGDDLESTRNQTLKINQTGNSVLLLENFHPIIETWYVRQLPAEKRETDIHYYDGLKKGYLYLNVTGDWSDQEQCSIAMLTFDDFDPPVGLQIRLKCSDDNGLQGDRGGGHRSWGFGERGPRFESFSPDSDEPLPGFWATSGNNHTVIRKAIAGIDMTQWHKYTILWDRGNAVFLIDGVIVAEIEEAPNEKIPAVCFLNNVYYRVDGSGHLGHWLLETGYLDLELDESIAIDYLYVAQLGLWSQDDGFGTIVEER